MSGLNMAAIEIDIIPRPLSITPSEGSFNVSGASFFVDKDCDAAYAVIELAERLTKVSGKKSRVVSRPRKGTVSFVTDKGQPSEGYSLIVEPDGVTVSASSRSGFLYAIQSLRQMMPAAVYGMASAVSEDWSIPCVKIVDKPRFRYRGAHLDCARHFFTVDQVKEYLDILSIYKINRFHWHLTDDHSWRLEIKKYPLLAEIGAHNCGAVLEDDPKMPGEVLYDGFYTQDDAREIVRYADRLGITVVPEIDMPSHMTAALAAYPDLGCTRGPYEVIRVVGPRGKGLAKDALCAGRDSTFMFIENVLDEVMEIFPSEYIHIGGDECIKDRWYECPDCIKRMEEEHIVSDDRYTNGQYLQVYFINRVQRYLESKGRHIIGWDEILDGNLDKGATIMSWRGVQTGLEASKRGFDVIMAPVSYCYLDYRQSTDVENEPRAFAGTVTIEKVYSFEPTDGMDSGQAGHVVGVQGNLWTDVIGVWRQVEYMLLPRLAALSEVQWCPSDSKDFARFRSSMERHSRIYDISGYTYARHLWGVIGVK